MIKSTSVHCFLLLKAGIRGGACGKRKCLKIFLEGRGRATVNQTNTGTRSQTTLGKLLQDRVAHVWAFPST